MPKVTAPAESASLGPGEPPGNGVVATVDPPPTDPALGLPGAPAASALDDLYKQVPPRAHTVRARQHPNAVSARTHARPRRSSRGGVGGEELLRDVP